MKFLFSSWFRPGLPGLSSYDFDFEWNVLYKWESLKTWLNICPQKMHPVYYTHSRKSSFWLLSELGDDLLALQRKTSSLSGQLISFMLDASFDSDYRFHILFHSFTQ